MPNEIIEKHNFELAKGKIQSLSRNVPSTISLNRFPTEGSVFSWNDHDITGSEANRLLVTPLQETLITQNTSIKNLFKIADEVCKALDFLDSEYISGILVAVQSARIASDQAKTASSKAQQASNQALEASAKALDASKKANDAQQDIKRTIEALQKTVSILKEFKEKVSVELKSYSSVQGQIAIINNKLRSIEQSNDSVLRSAKNVQSASTTLNSIKHLGDVDTIWEDIQTNKNQQINLHRQIERLIQHVNDATEHIKNDILALQQYRTMLKSYQHLGNIDAIWSDVEGHKTNLAGLHQQVDAFIEKVNQATDRINNDIAALQQYRSVLESYLHLGDVDAIWNDVEGHKTNLSGLHQQVDTFIEKVNQATDRINHDIAALQQYRSVLESYLHLGDVDAIWSDVEGHKANLAGLHEQVDNLISEVHTTQKEIKESIQKLEEENISSHIKYEKRIKIAYYVGGGAVGLSLINYILQLLGIL